MKKTNNKVRRASLNERLHFLFTGEIPNYWQSANKDVCLTLALALEDPEFPFCKINQGNPKMLKIVSDFLATAKFPYKTIEKYIIRQPVLPHEKNPIRRLFTDTGHPDYFPNPTKKPSKP